MAIPILKPDKDVSLIICYRLISFNSCVCKTMEDMVNCWLMRILENRNLPLQMPTWVSALQIQLWPPCEPGAPHPKYFYHAPTPFRGLLWPEEGVRYDLAVQYPEDPPQVQSEGSTSALYLEPLLLCLSQQRLLFTLCPRKWSASRIFCDRHQWGG